MLTDYEIALLSLSLKVALTAALFAMPIATALGFILARFSFPCKALLEFLCQIPLVLPPVAIGYGLLLLFAPATILGQFLEGMGLGLAFQWQGAALASMIMALPLMLRAIRQAFEAEPFFYGDIAASLGAGFWRRFYSLHLPLALPGLISAFILGFARALGEFGATISFAANIPGRTQTLPLALYTAIQTPGGDAEAIRLLIFSLALAFLSLFFSERLARRLGKKANQKTGLQRLPL